jgi:UPF0755 protein
MKKKLIVGITGLILLLLAFTAWKILGPAVSIPAGEYFYIKTGEDFGKVKEELFDKRYISNSGWFELVSKMLHYKTIKPGRYRLRKQMSLFNLVKMLRSGNQAQVNFVITKLRTKEDFARKTGSQFECDSLQVIHFLNNGDSLRKYGLDTNTVTAALMPYTYNLNWNNTPGKIFQKIYTAYEVFWTTERKQKANSLHLSPVQVSTLASIVEEETLNKSDKYNIASVYLNRIRIGMPLQADPTVKFALKDFGLKRILNVHLKTVSPYNTYLNSGLPPGPICTPSIETIDAVLDAPKTDYLYFVASSNFDGSSVFTSNLTDHSKYARAYQQALSQRLDSVKKNNPN